MVILSIMSKSRNLSTLSSKVICKSLKGQQDYDSCIEVLNSLQSNAQYIKAKANTNTTHNSDQLMQVEKFLKRTGLTLDRLDELSVIHVAGTKGKGTTCAFSESILRHHGYKTGFFSSPHLLEVRERIKINGKPIGKDEFSTYFWNIFTKLDEQKTDEHDMPLYFRFLTIMAFTIFIDKNVDVAIVEVGIGGEYDCTNVLRKVPVVGITSLAIDHTALLGNTIRSIAWNKAGIMKKGCKVFTMPQSQEALEVLRERSLEKNCELEVVNPQEFKFSGKDTHWPTKIFNLNASFAVALCDSWLKIKHNNNAGQLDKEITEKALASCKWPGRFQMKQVKNVKFYLDGAHTLESINICSDWFKNITKLSKSKKVLIFNVTGGRDAAEMLTLLQECNFDLVLFVTNNATKFEKSDNMNFKSTDELMEKCQQHRTLWLQLERQNKGDKAELVKIFPTVLESIEFVYNIQSEFNLLVTGSLHLVGAVLSIIEPDLNSCDG